MSAQQDPCEKEPRFYSADFNNDGKVCGSISDMFGFLRWCFATGPPPQVCFEPELTELPQCRTDLAEAKADLTACREQSGLPDTGQTICYDTEGNEIDCASDTCPGQDGFYSTGCRPVERFVDNRNGTVTDTCTGLMWQKDTADVNGDGLTSDPEDQATWCKSLAYCENLEFAGHDDWRLPNVRELQSIVDYGRERPSIDPVFGALSSFYWSSASAVSRTILNPRIAWYVNFLGGNVSHDAKDAHFLVRAVRGESGHIQEK